MLSLKSKFAEFKHSPGPVSALAYSVTVLFICAIPGILKLAEPKFLQNPSRLLIADCNWLHISPYILIFSRILPFGPEGPKWQDCFDTFCARAQKVQNKGWRSTA